MNKPMIENADRGITLNKSLAWTIATSLAVLVFWGGATLQSLTVATIALTDAIRDAKLERAAIELRVRAVENVVTKQGVQYDTLYSSIEEMKSLLRDFAKQQNTKPQ